MIPNSNSTIAVTGGTGFLGSHILRGLFEKGYKNIKALRREGSRMDLVEDIMELVQWVEGDVLDLDSLQQLVENCDYIIHSAAKVSYNSKDKKSVFSINVEGTANLVNVCIVSKPKKLIFLSSVAAIGRVKSGEYINEESEWEDSKFSTQYGYSKYLAELEVWRGMTEGLTIGIINPSMILGPSIWGDSSTKIFTHVINNKKLYPIGTNGFVDVRDAAKLTISYLESEVSNQRVIAVSNMISYKDLFGLMATHLNIKPPNREANKVITAIAWRFYKIKQMIFGGDPPLTKETVTITSGTFLYDNSKSKKLFNFEYIPIEKSVKDTLNKFKKSNEEKKSYAYFEAIFK